MRLRQYSVAGLIILLFISGISITMITGVWQSESSKIPALYSEGEFAGEYNPGDIRGSYTFSDVSQAFQISVDDLVSAFGLSEESSSMNQRIKIFEDLFGVIADKEIGTDSMRLFVALYLNRSYTPEEDTGLPLSAIDLLEEKGRINTEEALEYRRTYGVDTAKGIPVTGEGVSVDDVEETRVIKGKTTFRELIEWGLTKDEIEELIDHPIINIGESMRDFFGSKGLEFSKYKGRLQSILDEKGDE